MKLSYPKFRYYLLFFYYKLRILVDCFSGRGRLYLAELIHLWNIIFYTFYDMPGKDRIRKITTIFGTYKFIGDSNSYSVMSPAFERPDIEDFIGSIQRSLKSGKKILFLDIGANVGLYTIGITRFVNSKKFTIIDIEPDPGYHDLLLQNLQANKVIDVTVHNVALGNKNATIRVPGFTLLGDRVKAGTITFKLRKLDTLIAASYYKQFDEIYVKMDIEGHEEAAWDGCMNLLRSGKKIHVMIEDCVNPAIIDYLAAHKFRFIKKITPYDSFWQIN